MKKEQACPYQVKIDKLGITHAGVICFSGTGKPQPADAAPPSKECEKCGWYPPVEKQRREKIREELLT